MLSMQWTSVNVGAVVSDGGSQVRQARGFAHGRLQCLAKGRGAALSGLPPLPECYARTGQGLTSEHRPQAGTTSCCAWKPIWLAAKSSAVPIHQQKSLHLMPLSWAHARGLLNKQSFHRRWVMQMLLRMKRPPSLSRTPPEEPANPFVAQQNPFQPSTPVGQVYHPFCTL